MPISIDTDYVLFVIDNFIQSHQAYLKIRTKIDKDKFSIILNLSSEIPEVQKHAKKNFDSMHKEIIKANYLVLSNLTLFVIEIAKLFESEMSIFQNIANSRISREYSRLRYEKPKNVSSVKEMIQHYRDSLAHHPNKKISNSATYATHLNIERTKFFPYCVEKDGTWVFMVWDWMVTFDEFREIANKVRDVFLWIS